ncbi:MAG: hypothetical protein AAF327_10795 [Cyanobacteria bacterium P01_A01_bin.37]
MRLSLRQPAISRYSLGAIALVTCLSCGTIAEQTSSSSPSMSAEAPAISEEPMSTESSAVEGASVTAVEVSGEPGNYTFSVTVESPDTGCDQYADWWEVITDDGTLIHRRVLLHSHVSEQPFTRSSRPVDVQPEQAIIVRAHLSTTGYGTQALNGTVSSGFQPITLPADFAHDLANQPPLPQGCNF